MFIPDKECNCPDLVATTGDYLRIWHLTEEGTTLQKLLNNVSNPYLIFAPYTSLTSTQASNSTNMSLSVVQNKNSEFCAPLTSFDWNETDPKRLGTSSIDTTCTIWDIEVRPHSCTAPDIFLCMFALFYYITQTSKTTQAVARTFSVR